MVFVIFLESASPAASYELHVRSNLQVATHDVTDSTCMRGWLNSPVGLSMEQEIYKATNTVRAYYKVFSTAFMVNNSFSFVPVVSRRLQY